jgi:hypothetical protein
MKTAKIIPIAILCLLISVTIVSATHTSTVSMIPSSWSMNTDKSVLITVANANGDSITMVELTVPETSNQVPIYTIKDISTPQGWTYSLTRRTDQIYPYKITWIGSGITNGNSAIFGITALSPSASGNYNWAWKTTDKNGGTFTGTLTTNVGQAPVSSFVISNAPTTINAGSGFKINVKAYGSNNQLKTDYVGKITFTSTDAQAILPSDYTFQTSDHGSKDFTITYKSTGSQSFTIRDNDAGVSKDSIKTSVNAGTPIEISITPQDKKVSVGEKVEFKILAKDSLGNSIDVTNKATITIDKRAGGSWNKSVYTTANEGTWVVISSYNSLVSGTTLIVSGKAPTVVTPTEQINITPIVPSQGTPEVPEMSITVPEKITIAPGANDTTIVTVNNNGNTELIGVGIEVGGIPSDWISVYPLLNDIPAKSSKDYLVIIYVPENESGTKELEFKAKSSEGVTTSKNTSLALSTAPTGSFTMPKNILQLGVVIIAVAAVVIIGWELWFKKPKSK